MKDIVVIGDIMIDIVAIIEEDIHRGSDTVSNNSMQFGGAAANVATWLGIEQQPCRLVGAVGNDLFGELFTKRFAALSVTASLYTSTHNTGSVIAISHPDKERSMLAELGANVDVAKAFDESYIKEDSVVYVSGYILFQPSNAQLIDSIISRARETNSILVLDPASSAPIKKSVSTQLFEWLRAFDYILPNELEYATLLDLGYEKGQTIFEKRGSEGVLMHGTDTTEHVAAQPINVIDTVGAGDAFAAGFLCGLARGLGNRELAKLGIEFASNACQIRGATPGVLEIK